MVDPRFQRVDVASRELFIAAWEAAFSRNLDKVIYDWIFDKNNFMYTLTISGEIAAGYCLYPLVSMINGRLGKAMLCNNVFVSPEHQGKQLFVKIAKMALLNAAKKSDCILAYGIPNALALPGHRRVGWEVRSPISFLEVRRTTVATAIALNWAQHPLSDQQRSDIEACSLRAADGRGFSVIKTSEFVRWRYESKPNSKYWFGFKYKKGHLAAYCVCKYYSEHKTLHFIDIDGTDDGAIFELICEAEAIPEDFNMLNVWDASVHCDLFLLGEYQLSEQKSNLIFIDPISLRSFDIKGNINIVLGDNDVF